MISDSEKTMWEDSNHFQTPQTGNAEDTYLNEQARIITELNRERLPNFIQALKKPNHINIRPFYQRRARWSSVQQSKLIESFIANIPVPPVFLYEDNLNHYEVMDGQQRITALQNFYNNKLKLVDLELWPQLEGKTYSTLPEVIKNGLDRRSILSVVLMYESAKSNEEALFVKQKVFERLNTGGVQLSRQEVRNCLYQGDFNNLLFELSSNKIFTEAWGIPNHSVDNIVDHSDPLLSNTLFKTMGDAELVLRFFALRHIEQFKYGLQGFLDLYMVKAANFNPNDIETLRQVFSKTLVAAYEVYGANVFRSYDFEKKEWGNRPLKALYDAVMVGFSRNLDSRDILIKRKELVVERTIALLKGDEKGIFSGGGKSKLDIKNGVDLMSNLLSTVAS